MRRLRWAAWAIVVSGGVGYVAWRSSAPPAVDVVRPERRDVTSVLAVAGRVEAMESAELSSGLTGVEVRRVLVDTGSWVRAGQLLVELDDRELRAAEARALAQVAQAEAGTARARAVAVGAGRSVDLSRQTVERSTELRNARDQAEAQLASARERLAQARESAERVREGARREAVRAAQARVRAATVRLRQAERQERRAESLAAQGALPEAELDAARTDRDAASEEVASASANLEQLETPRTQDVREAEAAVREAEAGVAGAEAALRNADVAYRDRLTARQALAASEADRAAAVASVAAARAERRSADAALEQVRSQLAKTRVLAPIDGVVVARDVEPGELVAQGRRLLAIAAPRQLRIVADVDETNLETIRVGQRAAVSPDAFPDLRIEGRVAEIAAAANPERGTVEVRIAIPQREAVTLKPDLTVDVNIVTASARDALTVPRLAVLRPDTSPRVLVVEGGTAVERTVRLAEGDAERWVVTAGLTGQEMLVADPRNVQPGRSVSPRTVARRAEARQ